MLLRDHNADQNLNYFDSKEVMELLHVCHLEFVGEEGLHLVDID